MHTSLFTPAPRRNGRLVLTLTGSLLFHGSLIGVAAFWPVRPVPEPPKIITFVDDQGGDPVQGPSVPPEATPTTQEPVQPDLKVADPVDTPPPIVEAIPDDMILSTPVPPSKPRTAARTATPTVAAHSVRAPGSPAATGNPSGVAENGGAAAGVRWNKPKPAYPAALRLARVQGSGVVRVTTDASGRVVSATIVQSTGNAMLDDNTCRSARSFWSGPPNSTLSVPITYQIP